MSRKPTRVRDLKRAAKEFPRYRRIIEDGGWVPHVLCDSNGAYWDGLTACDRDGNLMNALSDAGRKQLTNMILDGYFGEEAKDAFVDPSRYWKIRDDLIDRPNEEAIREENLRVLAIRRKARIGLST